MEEILAVEDRHYILAGSSLGDPRTLVLKDDRSFAVFGPSGDIDAGAGKSHGLYKDDMRYLSRLETRLQGRRPICLSAGATTDNSRLVADLTNPDISADGHVLLQRGTAHIARSKYLSHGALFEKLVLGNFSENEHEYQLALSFDADIIDIFQVRGTPREKRGRRLEPRPGPASVELGYEGLDGIRRRTRIDFDPPPTSIGPSGARYLLRLRPGERRSVTIAVRCDPTEDQPASYARARRLVRSAAAEARGQTCRVSGGYEHFTRWARRSTADVRMLTTQTTRGLYPYAGIPWYCTPFGRDGIITAYQLLWARPAIAAGVLRFLAANQCDRADPGRDAEPGKILHEFRDDEMANTGEVPFGRYYGTVDATPLFLMLAGEHLRVTGDLELARDLWPNIQRALEWCGRSGDLDGDGFLEYQSRNPDALTNQGWKDSHDSVFHADGALASGPIALCEVQGYAYAGKLAAADLAAALGHSDTREHLLAEASALKERFHRAFWVEEIGTYAAALDGEKRPCAVRTSNPGHCLWTGIADERFAPRVAETMLSPEMFSGWGVRTVASGEARYNPMSYHNGSVWPHDNAILMAGLTRYSLNDPVERLMTSWLEASEHFGDHRLPELFCGFRRRPSTGPTLYPVACSPQAWAAGAFFMMCQACLGLTIDAAGSCVRVCRPRLPERMGTISLRNLRIGPAVLDLLFHREGDDVGVLVQRRRGDATVVVEK
jgi:glycogen debranching enzyme